MQSKIINTKTTQQDITLTIKFNQGSLNELRFKKNHKDQNS